MAPTTGYVENEDHVPNPTDAYGTLDTSGTGGGAHARIEEVTPIFDVAKSQDLATAARALDPDDPEVHASLVTLPEGQRITPVDPEAAADRVRAAAEAAPKEVDLSTSRMTPAKEAAAEELDVPPETENQPDPTAGTGAGSTAGGDAGERAATEEPEKPGEKAGRRGHNKPE